MDIPTPHELDKIQKEKDDGMYRKVVDDIAQHLTQHYVTGGFVTLTVSASLVNDRIIMRVVREFNAHYWIVEFGGIQGDQRDGNFYSVKVTAEPGYKTRG